MENTTPKNAIIAYRGNQSLDLIVPVIAEAVRDKYCLEIATQRFDPKTTPDEITQWSQEHQSELESTLIISDKTFFCAFAESGAYKVWEESLKEHKNYSYMTGTLDDIAAKSAVQFVQRKTGCFDEKIISKSTGDSFPRSGEGYGLNLEQTRQAYIALLSYVTEKPSHIFIIRNHLDDHLPFQRYSNNDENQRIIRSWLEEGLGLDVPITECYGVPDLYDKERYPLTETRERANLSYAWVVVDRHYSGRQTGTRITGEETKRDGFSGSVIYLRLPIEEFILDAISQGVYDQQFKDFEPEYLRLVKTNIIEEMQSCKIFQRM